MAGNLKEEIIMENIENKKETEDEILQFSTVLQDACTVYMKEEDVKMEITDIQGKFQRYINDIF